MEIEDISMHELWERYHKLRCNYENAEDKVTIAVAGLKFYAKHNGASNRVALDILKTIETIDSVGDQNG